jgi:tetratricopeptide (TPR) repeat protein
MHRIARIILIYTFLTFYACHTREIQHPEPLQKAITHFYTENENEEVLQQLELLSKNPLDDISKELVTVFRAGALCEQGQVDSAALIIKQLDPKKIQTVNTGWYNNILGLILFRQNEYAEAYKSLLKVSADKNNDLRAIALSERLLARISFLLSDQDKALEWLLLSTRHFKKLEMPKSEAVNLKILGRHYMNNGEFQEALSYFCRPKKPSGSLMITLNFSI